MITYTKFCGAKRRRFPYIRKQMQRMAKMTPTPTRAKVKLQTCVVLRERDVFTRLSQIISQTVIGNFLLHKHIFACIFSGSKILASLEKFVYDD